MMDPIIYNAASKGDVEVLGQKNADQLEAQRAPNKDTVLHVAAQFGQTECVSEILHKCGKSLLCSVNIKGDSSLHISAREEHASVVQALIEYAKEVDKELENGNGTTKEMLRMRNVDDETALHEAVRNNNNLDVVVILTKEDSEFVHPPNKAKETPLFLAAERHNSNIVSKILENCTSPAYSDPNGRTALHVALIYYSRDKGFTFESLLSWKQSLIKEADVYGWTPLHYAAWFGHVLVVKQLLDLDKSVAYLTADKNNTALHIAASQGKVGVMKEILSYCPDCWKMDNSEGQNILHVAAKYKKRKTINFVVKNLSVSGLINQKDEDGNTPSHLAAAATVRFRKCDRLRFHPKVDRKACNKDNLTPGELASLDPIINEQVRGGFRNKFKLHKKKRDSRKEKYERQEQRFAKLMDNAWIVATLITTVTFAAGFTVPGGFDSNNGSKQGMAVLARQAAFNAFVLSDTIAMVFSIIAASLLFFASTYDDERKRKSRQASALLFIEAAMFAMVIAFMTGLCAVLEHSSGLSITVWVICLSFFCIFGFLYGRRVYDIYK